MKDAAIVEYKIKFEDGYEMHGEAYFIVGKSSTGKSCVILEEARYPAPGKEDLGYPFKPCKEDDKNRKTMKIDLYYSDPCGPLYTLEAVPHGKITRHFKPLICDSVPPDGSAIYIASYFHDPYIGRVWSNFYCTGKEARDEIRKEASSHSGFKMYKVTLRTARR